MALMSEAEDDDLATAELNANEDPRMAPIRRRAQRLLIEYGGECNISQLEADLGCRIPEELLRNGRFFVDDVTGLVGLPGILVSRAIEAPSFRAYAEEDAYWALGQEVLKSGLVFAGEDRFRELFDDLLAKREEIRRLLTRPGVSSCLPGARLGQSRSLPQMTQGEVNLFHATGSRLRALQTPEQPWVPLSILLDDILVRRARPAVPKGIALWEWMAYRFGNDLHMVTDGRDLLLNHGTGGGGAASAPAEKSADYAQTKRQVMQEVFRTLRKLQRDFPDAGGLAFADLARLPGVKKFMLPMEDVRGMLAKNPQIFQVFRELSGWSVRLCPGLTAAATATGAASTGSPGAAARTRSPTPPLRGSSPGRPLSSFSPVPQRSHSPTYGAGGDAGGSPGGFTVADWAREQSSRFKGLPPLPSGWLRAVSRSTGQIYYVNEKTGRTQFHPPRRVAE